MTRPESVEWSSTPGLQTVIDTLAFLEAEDEIRVVVFHVTTNGGQIGRLDEASEAVAALREKKRTITYAADSLLSAGYWWGCQAEELVCNPLALVGGLGVFTVLIDTSEHAKHLGLRRIVVSSGGIKGLDFGDEVPTELIEDHKRIILEQAEHFKAAVGRGRPHLAEKEIDELFDGRAWMGEKARDRGLVDRVLSFRQFRQELLQETESSRSTLILPTTQTTETEMSDKESKGASVDAPETPQPQPAPSPPQAVPGEVVLSAPSGDLGDASSFFGTAVAAALRFFQGQQKAEPEPEPQPSIPEAERQQHLASSAREIMGHLQSSLAAKGVETIPAHEPVVRVFALTAARDILRSGRNIDPNLFPATALAKSKIGDDLTPEMIFPEASDTSLDTLTAAWNAPRPRAHHQPNLAQPTGTTEGLIPQGQALPVTEESSFSPMGFTATWSALTAEQREVLESEEMTETDFNEYREYVLRGGDS